jgi:preprotein translocase subunit SecB
MPVRLNIVDIRVLKIDYSLGPETADKPAALQELSQLKEQTVEMKMNFNFKSEYLTPENNQPILKVMQGVHVTGSPPIPFSVYVEMGGLFTFEPQPAPDELDRLRHINCNAILFPYARELVTDICRRGGVSQVYLPPVNFVQLHKDGVFKQEQQAQEGGNAK